MTNEKKFKSLLKQCIGKTVCIQIGSNTYGGKLLEVSADYLKINRLGHGDYNGQVGDTEMSIKIIGEICIKLDKITSFRHTDEDCHIYKSDNFYGNLATRSKFLNEEL